MVEERWMGLVYDGLIMINVNKFLIITKIENDLNK